MILTRDCTKCGKCLPLDRFKTRAYKLADGTPAEYTLRQCRQCVNSRNDEGRKRRRASIAPEGRQHILPPEPGPALAVRIAERAVESPIAVFRNRGRLAWCDARRAVPSGADVLGYYDYGADVRAIRADLECAA